MRRLFTIISLFLTLSLMGQNKVPDTYTFSLQDVVGITGGSSLGTAFGLSVPSYFDSRYAGNTANSMRLFRNYGGLPPTYSWSVTRYGGATFPDFGSVDECEIIIFTCNTTNVPNGTVFRLRETGGNYSAHYVLVDPNSYSPLGYNSIEVQVVNNVATAQVAFIQDHSDDSDTSLNFQFELASNTGHNTSKTMMFSERSPAFQVVHCGDWGADPNQTEHAIRLSGDCMRLQSVLQVKLYNTSFGTPVLLKTWNDTDITLDNYVVDLAYQETGYTPDPNSIRTGGRYSYRLDVLDIYGGTTSFTQNISCQVYKIITLCSYDIYWDPYPISRTGALGIRVQTNMTYGQYGQVTAHLVSGPAYTNHTYFINQPDNGGINYVTYATELGGDAYHIDTMPSEPIYFTLTGDLFTEFCGEHLTAGSLEFPQGSTEPINICP